MIAPRLALSLILLFSAGAKLADPLTFVTTLDLYRFLLPGHVAAWTIALELVAGLLLLTGWHQRVALGVTGTLLVAYWGVTLFGPGDLVRCGCFGSIGPHLTFGQHVALLSVMTVLWGGLIWDGVRRGDLLWRGLRRRIPPERVLVPKRRQQAFAAVLLMVLLPAAAMVFAGTGLSRRSAVLLTDARPFQAIPVATLDGKPTTIDATRRPVLFFAWWCSHCEKLMKDMAGTPLPNRPVLVSTFLRSKNFAENRDLTLAKLRKVGVVPEEGWTVYLDQSPKALVKSVPTLAYLAGGRWHVEVMKGIEALKAAMDAAGKP